MKSHLFLFFLAAGAVLCCLVCFSGCTSQSATTLATDDAASVTIPAVTGVPGGRPPDGIPADDSRPIGTASRATPPEGMIPNGTHPDARMMPNGTPPDGMAPGRVPPDTGVMPNGTPPQGMQRPG